MSGNNGKLSNKYFAEKRDMNEDGKEQGYKFSRLWLNKHLSTLTKWDIEELEKRYQIIFERFEKIWVYPSVTIEDLMADESETNIFDADEPTFKKLDYALFFDQRLDIKNISSVANNYHNQGKNSCKFMKCKEKLGGREGFEPLCSSLIQNGNLAPSIYGNPARYPHVERLQLRSAARR